MPTDDRPGAQAQAPGPGSHAAASRDWQRTRRACVSWRGNDACEASAGGGGERRSAQCLGGRASCRAPEWSRRHGPCTVAAPAWTHCNRRMKRAHQRATCEVRMPSSASTRVKLGTWVTNWFLVLSRATSAGGDVARVDGGRTREAEAFVSCTGARAYRGRRQRPLGWRAARPWAVQEASAARPLRLGCTVLE